MLLFMDGCDHLGSADLIRKWDAVDGVIVHAGEGKWAGGALGSNVSIRAGSHLVRKVVTPGTPTEGLFGYWLYGDDPGSIVTVDVIVQAGSGSTDLLTFAFSPTTGTIRVYRGHPDSGVLLGTSTASVMVDNTWTHIEARWLLHASAGQVEVRANGVIVLLLDGVNTGSSAWNAVLWAPGAGERVDDPYILDRSGSSLNYFLGHRKRIRTLYPAANGSLQDWSGSGATGYQAIDEAAFNAETDYLYARAAARTSTFAMQDLDAGVTGISAIQLNALARRRSTSFPATVRTTFRDTNGSSVGTAVTPPTGYSDLREIWTTMPNGDAITAAALNAAEFDAERAA